MREHKRCAAAEREEAEPRFRDSDIWPVVFAQNIQADIAGRDRLMAYAKRCGGSAMLDFVFKNYQRIPDLITRAWQTEHAEERVKQFDKTRIQILAEAAAGKCVCAGRWKTAALELLAANDISHVQWAEAVFSSLQHGRQKGSLVTHAGLVGDEGKSFLLQPLFLVYGQEQVFVCPDKGSFPLLSLPSCRLALLDDRRFQQDLIPYAMQLLWFEGKPFEIPRPQNQHDGHYRYVADAPVFITTLESDIHALKPGVKPGDVQMMLKRLKIFRFHRSLVNPDRSIVACAKCFAELLLATSPAAGFEHTLSGTSPAAGIKRTCPGWSVQDVCEYLQDLELGHVTEVFRQNAVDGALLMDLSEADLVSELGLTRLQARKIKMRLQ